jgi:Domain of unknown function (DUF4340)
VKPKAFATLAAITLGMLVVAVATYVSQNRVSQVRVSGEALFPGLAGKADRIAKIVITQGNTTLALARDKQSWSLENRGGYPAKTETARALLIGLAEAELVEAKTSSKEHYSVLELENPRDKDAKSRLVQLLDDKGNAIAEVVVGKKRSDAFGSSRGGTYVRRPGDAQSWLANVDINAPIGARDWVQPNIIDIPSQKIAGVDIEIVGEEPLKIVRDATDASKHTLAAMPNGKKLKDNFAIGAIVRAAGSIELEDVRRADSSQGQEAGTVLVEADGGLKVTLRLRKEGDDYWLSAEASGAEGEAKKTAEDIMRHVQGWQFKVSTTKAQSILKRRADIFEAS